MPNGHKQHPEMAIRKLNIVRVGETNVIFGCKKDHKIKDERNKLKTHSLPPVTLQSLGNMLMIIMSAENETVQGNRSVIWL